MKKTKALLCTFLLCIPLIATAADVKINETNFPDENFRKYLQRQDFGKDGVLTEAELKEITILYTGYQNISSLKGIEYFTELTDLHCYGNQLTTLDVSKNTKLIKLYCYDNLLTTLNVSGCKTLTDIDCYHNMIKGEGMDAFISSLPEKNTGERASIFMYNDIKGSEGNVCTTFQVSAAEKKGWSPLYCTEISEDGLSSKWSRYEGTNNDSNASDSIAINSTNFPDENFRNYLLWQDYGKDRILTKEEIKEITVLYIGYQNISSLKGIECFTELTDLHCYGNQLTTLDVSKNTKLIKLYCDDNQLTTLNVSGCKSLTYIDCYQNMIKGEGMDAFINSLPEKISGESANIHIYNAIKGTEGNVCTQTQVAAIKAKGWRPLYCREINGNTSYWSDYLGSDAPNGITIDLTNFPDPGFCGWLHNQEYGKDNILTEEEIAQITEIDLTIGTIYNINSLKGIEYFTSLEYLNCSNYYKLTSLDVSKNTALTSLCCTGNLLTSLDVSNNTKLTKLICDKNQLTSLDISNNTSLTELSCSQNQLTSLDVSNNTSLIELNCGYNQLTSLDVSNNIELTSLWCANNMLTSLDLTNNTELTTVSCAGNLLTSLDVSYNTKLTNLFCWDNHIKGAAMDALVSSLPKTSAGKLHVYYEGSDEEGNVITKSQVAAAKTKGWISYYTTDDLTEYEYEGSDDESVGIVSPNTKTDNTNAPVYNISGQHVTTMKKGLYIINGKKVLVK